MRTENQHPSSYTLTIKLLYLNDVINFSNYFRSIESSNIITTRCDADCADTLTSDIILRQHHFYVSVIKCYYDIICHLKFSGPSIVNKKEMCSTF